MNQRENLSSSIVIPEVKHGRPNYGGIESNQSLNSLEAVFQNSILNTVEDQVELVPTITGVKQVSVYSRDLLL